MSALRHVMRWIAWQIGESDPVALDQPPARITVFSSDSA
jgi:hypothetical protein